MGSNADVKRFMDRYVSLAKKCKRENRMLMNHSCIRVEDIDAAEKLLKESFGISGFVRPGGYYETTVLAVRTVLDEPLVPLPDGEPLPVSDHYGLLAELAPG